MKGIDYLCSSPASTAICSNNTVILDRHVHLGKIKQTANSQFSIHHHQLHRRKSTSSSSSSNSSAKKFINHQILRRKSSADAHDLHLDPTPSSYLLSEKRPFLDFIPLQHHHHPSHFSKNLLLLSSDNNNNNNKYYKRLNSDTTSLSSTPNSYQSPLYKNAALPQKHSSHACNLISVGKPASATSNNDRVVELRVSIHCKGCEGKLRKHISKMEGVTRFSIDLSTKKVTVIGDVSPVDVLTSISKVKNAQFWSPPRVSVITTSA